MRYAVVCCGMLWNAVLGVLWYTVECFAKCAVVCYGVLWNAVECCGTMWNNVE